MNVGQLKARLAMFEDHHEVLIVNHIGDRTNIRLGPTPSTISQINASDSADCKGREGERIVVIG